MLSLLNLVTISLQMTIVAHGTTAALPVTGERVKTALMLVDIQNDFLPPSGSLAVTNGRDILPTAYKLLDEYEWDLVVASMVSLSLSLLENSAFISIFI